MRRSVCRDARGPRQHGEVLEDGALAARNPTPGGGTRRGGDHLGTPEGTEHKIRLRGRVVASPPLAVGPKPLLTGNRDEAIEVCKVRVELPDEVLEIGPILEPTERVQLGPSAAAGVG